jgi:hypothetical protein
MHCRGISACPQLNMWRCETVAILKRVSLYAAPLMFASLFVLFGCTMLTEEMPGVADSAGEPTGTIRIELTDAPLFWTDVKEFHVFIERIEVYSYLSDWKTLVEIGQDYDLLKLRSGASATLTVQEIKEGNYSGMRLVLGKGNWLYLDDGGTLRRVDIKLARDESALVALLNNFNVQRKTTSTYVIDFDAEKSLVEKSTDNPVMDPWVEVKGTKTEGRTIFSEDFGTGPDQDDIPGWVEQEHSYLEYKCRVEDGSPLGGRLARMYGQNLATVNHSFGKHLDLSGYAGGILKFQVRGSDNWGYFDRVYLEFFYDGAWHAIHTFNTDEWVKAVSEDVNYYDYYLVEPTLFQPCEIRLTEEMMSVDFWMRFRNGMGSKYQFFDVDNVEVYVR